MISKKFDGKFLQSGLAVLALRLGRRKPKHRSGFQIPTRHKAVYAAPTPYNLKPRITRGL